MVAFPISPRHSRLILAAAELLQSGRFQDPRLLLSAIALAAVLSAESPFLESSTVVQEVGRTENMHARKVRRKHPPVPLCVSLDST
jgi:Helicase associated domain (HA2)